MEFGILLTNFENLLESYHSIEFNSIFTFPSGFVSVKFDENQLELKMNCHLWHSYSSIKLITQSYNAITMAKKVPFCHSTILSLYIYVYMRMCIINRCSYRQQTQEKTTTRLQHKKSREQRKTASLIKYYLQ